MAHALLLQDWITVRGNAGSTVVFQQEDSYADLMGYQDVGIFVEVSDFAGTPSLQFSTSPTKEASMFALMSGGALGPGAAGVSVIYVRYASAAIPLARWVRWSLSGAAAWSLTFRVWLSAIPV